MRLDKYLQLTKNLSKKEIQQLLKQQKVSVNHVIMTSPKYDVSDEAIVYINGKEIEESPYIYLMMNKPAGILSALKDAYKNTVLDLIEHSRKDSLRIMGRLDQDTTGLIILTNNTQAIKKITMPESHVEKEYEVTLLKPISKAAIVAFEKGIMIDRTIQLKPAKLILLDDYHVRVIISEGKYHQIKKMFLTINNQVISLKRIRIHHLYLDESLALGQFRSLSKHEIKQLIPK